METQMSLKNYGIENEPMDTSNSPCEHCAEKVNYPNCDKRHCNM